MNNLEEEKLVEVENQYWVDMFASLQRLNKNEDFKRLILQGYFKDKAVNGVSLLAQDAIIVNGKRPNVIESLIAISNLEDFFITVENLGGIAPEEDTDEFEEA